ncbi:hypothetical protein N658DRAFT_417058 [Parathielavia hyrcaniae]|uniref:DUF7053 domain-containing protein n=1 Tax=Parathielavia hyrcaniae TaxID=113614 RepID=A0AAN6QCU4_9PEZI|nr:hypothetical protein N658DRAFT_417058 [Parathielavia hyrcaniae]
MTHTTHLPAGTTRTQALAMLSDHEFFLSCDPHLHKYDPMIPAADLASATDPAPSFPDEVRSQLRRRQKERGGKGEKEEKQKEEEEEEEAMMPLTTCYRVTDVVHAVPAGIWDTNVVSTYEFTDIRDGVFVRIRSPLSIVMDTFWEVREVDGDGDGEGLELVEDMTISCSRLLMGLVRGQCENGWGKIHAKMIARLEAELK